MHFVTFLGGWLAVSLVLAAAFSAALIERRSGN